MSIITIILGIALIWAGNKIRILNEQILDLQEKNKGE